MNLEVNVSVDEKAVERAVAMLEWYCNDNGMLPIVSRQPDGKIIVQVTYDSGAHTCPTCGNTLSGQQTIPGFTFAEDESDAK